MANDTSNDPFDNLLELEDQFYKEGYNAGVSDSEYAGFIEGKVFGIEKGYEKALELAKLHGRAMLWKSRLESSSNEASPIVLMSENYTLPSSFKNLRLSKHVENLLTLSNGKELCQDNTDDAVSIFDEHLVKAQAKAKIIANILDETLTPNVGIQSSIEDATGLNARH